MATVLLYYHSPCVNTQATYSIPSPTNTIVNADVIQCVLIVYAQAAGVGKTDPGPVATQIETDYHTI